MRFRHVFMSLGLALAVTLMLVSDPDTAIIKNLPFGATTIASMVSILSVIFYIGILHLSRRGLFDYVDLSALFEKAQETAQGAGLAIIGMGLFTISISLMAVAAMMQF